MDLNKELKELELTELNEKAENAVAVAVASTAVTGFVPIPFADAPLLIAQQVALMASICAIYKIDIEKDGLKMLATAAIGAGGAAVVGKTLATNLLKMIPGVGTAAGGVVSGGTAGVVTLAMGKAFIEVCKMVKVGKLSEADLTSSKGTEIMKQQFREQLIKAKKK
ncbi:YcjF family protein [Gemmiger sp.]